MTNASLVTSSLILATFLAIAQGTLPILGTVPIDQVRNELPDSAFKFNLKNGVILKNDDYVARFSDVSKDVALAAPDVQFHLADLEVKAGKSFFRHTHPRSAEALFAVRGTLRVTFEFEGLNPRKVKNIVRSGEFAVVPQGLIHEVACAGKKDCFFVVFFKTADPGLIPA